MTSVDREQAMNVARTVAPAFFKEGKERVYVASCCGRVIVKPAEVTKCRTCDGTPEGFWITEADL